MGTAPEYSVEIAMTNPELLKDGETKKGAESLEEQGNESHAKKDSTETLVYNCHGFLSWKCRLLW